MRILAKAGIGLAVASLVGMAFLAFPGAAGIAPVSWASNSNLPPMLGPANPGWNTGNLCTQFTNTSSSTSCYSDISGSPGNPTLLTYNFENTPATAQGWTTSIEVGGSYDCIVINVHSFYSTINLKLDGSYYSCAGKTLSGALPAGVNLAINSENDSLHITQLGSNYDSAYFVYGTTVPVYLNVTGSWDGPTVNYIGTGPGFNPCPWALESKPFVVPAQLDSYGSYNAVTLNWINGPGYSGLNMGPTTTAWPVTGDFGTGNTATYQISTTAPADSCGYFT
jgi:hypothetical protein